ncbi:hypothetical protein D3C78_1019130 [compost metagenome]
MRRAQRDGLAQVAQGVVQRLVGQAVHQVEVEVVEPGIARHVGGANRFVTVVNAPQGLKLGLLEALDADRQAIDAQLPVGLELLLLERPGIGLEGDFDIAGKRDALLHTLQQPAQSAGAEQAGGAAAKEDRADRPAIDSAQFLVEVGQQGIDVRLFRQLRRSRVGVEVAVRAFAHAPGNMDVQRQRRQLRQGRPRCLGSKASLAQVQWLCRRMIGHARPRR